ncbi:MAG: hypothetical protein PHC51_03920 [bacterium]|nr:hypothetical protein [bacterium]
MEKKEIEVALKKTAADMKKRIEDAPVPAFFVGMFAGVVLAVAPRGVFFLLLLMIISAGIIWHLGEEGEKKEAEKIE